MSRESMLIVIGVLVAIAPFSGLPHSWQAVILPVLGLICGVIGYAARREQVKRAQRADSSAFELSPVRVSNVA